MPTDIQLGEVFFQKHESANLTEGEVVTDDRVRHTASDRPNTDTLPALADPSIDHLDIALAQRRADVDEKHRRVAEFLDQQGLDALTLGDPATIAWFTSGGDLRVGMNAERASVRLYVNQTSRAILADNVQSPRVFEEELAGLGFQLKEHPWHEEAEHTIQALCRGKKIATDLPGSRFPNKSEGLRGLRLSLTKLDRQRLRELGRTLALCLEATCRNFEPGETEADVAGHLAHRLLREGVVPVDLQVASDDRLARFRRPTFKAAPIQHRAIITATVRRHGLCASATRIVSFGPVDPALQKAHALATMVDATYIFFSRPGESIAQVFRRARRIYEKFGAPHEWTLDYQGTLIGHAPRELLLRPEEPMLIPTDAAICWSPSVRSARSEDTIVVDHRGFEVVTEAQRWPKVEVLVKGFAIPRPGILER